MPVQITTKLDLDALLSPINQEWSRLETRESELKKELSEIVTAKRKLQNIKKAIDGKAAAPLIGTWSGNEQQIELRRQIVIVGQHIRRAETSEKPKLEKQKQELQTKLRELRKPQK